VRDAPGIGAASASGTAGAARDNRGACAVTGQFACADKAALTHSKPTSRFNKTFIFTPSLHGHDPNTAIVDRKRLLVQQHAIGLTLASHSVSSK